jgi:hypothetical protein
MRKLLFLLSFLFIYCFSFADQLAYISKEEAEKASEFIQTQKAIYLFCGCCENERGLLIKPTKVYAKFTNYENYYEVIVEYLDKNGETQTVALDLAYTWYKEKRKFYTVGKKLKLEHDPCKKFKASYL